VWDGVHKGDLVDWSTSLAEFGNTMALAVTARGAQRTVVRAAVAHRAADIARMYHGDQVPQAGNYYDYFGVSIR
jgi:hypothetical protein